MKRVEEKKDKEEVLQLMEPLIAEWFDDKFDNLTEPQSYAIPLIHERENVLVSSPTGSGKTLTAFLSIINELFKLDKKGELEDKIYCVYVSPLKALANDIHKNLEKPLAELKDLAEEKDVKIPDIRTAIRSGDTSQNERRKMAKTPPHIFITTPESLALALSSPQFRKKFDDVQYFINDEIHEISSSKRGVYLSLNTERLEEHIKGEMTRIGLSATQAPIEEIAKFLGGYENGEPRPVNVIEVAGEKNLDLSVMSPVDDMTLLPYEVVNSRMYDTLTEMVQKHRTTLIFTNTRSGAENVAYKLKDRGIDDVAAHHGSLSKETRLDVEDGLKTGELRSVVSSTSLELGIDIGYIDMVVQVNSPKSVAKGLQRVGRAGHSIGETSKGRMIVFDKDDLIECSVITRKAYQHDIDRVSIPENNLDVLSQTIIGMSIEHRWDVEDAYEMIKRSYCYKHLPEEDYLSVLNYLAAGEFENVYPKIWYNEEEGVFGKKGGVQMLYYMNVGTIPSDSSYQVYSEKAVPLGTLSEKFVERLSKGDVFILGSHSYEFLHTRGTKVFVKDAAGKKPTVPSWSGEMLPRSYDLSVGMGGFRRKLSKKMEEEKEENVIKWLREKYRIDEGSAQTIISYFKEQLAVLEELPTDEKILIEGHIGQDGNYNIIFHACFGRETNDALSRAYAYKISKKFNCNANVSITDDNFMITTGKRIPLDDIEGLLSHENIETVLKRCIRNTELFEQRFRHCAQRALMLLRNYKGREISVSNQKIRSKKILEKLQDDQDFPIVKETFNEILHQVLNLDKAKEVLKGIESGNISITTADYSDTPSPFAHGVLMAGISDVIMMEDRSNLLRQYHQKVLEQVIPEEEIEKFKFDRDVVNDHYQEKRPSFDSKDEMLEVIEELQPIHVFKEKGNNVFTRTERSFEEVRRWGKELLKEGKIQSLWVGGANYIASKDLEKFLFSLDQGEQPHGSSEIIDLFKESEKDVRELFEDTDLRLKDVKELVRDLERKRLVSRIGMDEDGDHRYALLEKKDRKLEIVEEIIIDHLEYEAPRSLEEIAHALDLPEDIALKALNNLVEQNTIVSGRLVVGEGEQYMLKEDYHELRFPGGEHVSEDKASEYRAKKQFSDVGSIQDYFELFMETGTPYDVYQRVSDFSLERWRKMREKGEIVEGRFVRGRVRYALRETLPMFVGAYRTEELDEEERNILQLIEKGKARTIRELKNESDLKNDRIKEIVKKLDYNLYIRREFTGEEGWSSRNRYKKVDVDALPEEEAKKRVIIGYLKGSGPASFSNIRYYTGFQGKEIREILSELVHQKELKKIKVGASEREMYILSEEINRLQKVKGGEYDKLRVLSKKDPYARPLWAEIYRRYGDDWIFPLIKKGDIVGGIEKWKMSGCIEIRHLDVDDESMLPEVLRSVDEMMNFHRLEGYDIVRIKYYQNTPVEDLSEDELSIFLENGYKKIQGMLVKGNVVEDVFEEEQVRSYVFKKQRLDGEKYSDPKEAVKEMKGARSDFELRTRVHDFFSLEWMYKRGKVYAGKMIPPYHMYALPEHIATYRTAKDVGLSNSMETVLDIIERKSPAPKRTVYYLSPYSRTKTKEIIDSLYAGLFVVRDHNDRYVSTSDFSSDLSSWEAKKEGVRWAFENFGVFTAEKLSSYLGKDYRMNNIRMILDELVEEDHLSKGFLVEGDESVYWILSKGLDGLPDISFSGEGVITTKDRLNLYFREEIKEEFDMGSSNLVYKGPEFKAAFDATINSEGVKIREFEGSEGHRKIIERWAYEHNMGVKSEDKKKKKKVSDYEIRKWYEKTRGI
ncbi:MAG: ATP-dependent helicase [Candidatus Thermoplasmatota archaeon]